MTVEASDAILDALKVGFSVLKEMDAVACKRIAAEYVSDVKAGRGVEAKYVAIDKLKSAIG